MKKKLFPEIISLQLIVLNTRPDLYFANIGNKIPDIFCDEVNSIGPFEVDPERTHSIVGVIKDSI